MIILFGAIITFCSIVSLIMGGAAWSCIIALLLGAGLVVCGIFNKIKPLKGKYPVICAGLIAASFAVSLVGTPALDLENVRDRQAATRAVMVKIEAEDYETAETLLSDYRNQYGEDDESIIARVLLYYVQERYNDAYGLLNPSYTRIKMKTQEYYAFVLDILHQINPNEYRNVLFDAARKFPDWAEINLLAGIQSIDNGNYVTAEYFLRNAFMLDDGNPVTLLHLGIAYCNQGKYGDARKILTEAQEYAKEDYLKDDIGYYLQIAAKGAN